MDIKYKGPGSLQAAVEGDISEAVRSPEFQEMYDRWAADYDARGLEYEWVECPHGRMPCLVIGSDRLAADIITQGDLVVR